MRRYINVVGLKVKNVLIAQAFAIKVVGYQYYFIDESKLHPFHSHHHSYRNGTTTTYSFANANKALFRIP